MKTHNYYSTVWQAATPKDKIEHFEHKIMRSFDVCNMAYDFQEMLEVCVNDADRALCWNAAMNLVEQGRVHLVQLRNMETAQVRWVLVAFPYRIISNDTFLPPGEIYNAKRT